MAADIEFNVRNGMTVGADKHMVLNTAGALSASNITITSGGTILSGGQEMTKIIEDVNTSTLGEIPSVSADWNSTRTTTNTYSADWQSVTSDVNATSADWNSTRTTTNAYSADWQSVTSDVNTVSANWELAHSWGDHAQGGYLTSETTTSLALNTNSLDYTDEDGITTSIDLSKYLDEDARAIASGTLNSTSGIVTFTRDDATTFTLDLSDLLDDTNLVTSVNGSNGVVVLKTDDVVDTDQTNKYITAAQLDNLDSTHTTFGAYSADWQSVTSSVNTTSANWNLAHGWGNHASQNYLTSVSENDVTQHQDALHVTTTVSNNSADWETAHGWGNHASQNYLTSETTTSLSLASETDTLTYTDETGTENTISLAAYTGGGVTTIADATDTGISSPLAGDVLVYVNGTTQQWQNKKDRASLEDMYNYANANFYSEMGYTDDKLTSIDVWVTSSKSTALFERELTYNASGQLTSVVTRDVQGTGGNTRATLTKTLTYTETGALATVTRSYS